MSAALYSLARARTLTLLPLAVGKTACALAVAAALGRRTLVVVNRGVLALQWRHDIVGKGWTWADNHEDVDAPAADAPFLEHAPCATCPAYLERDTRGGVVPPGTAATCIACGHGSVPTWACTVPPRLGWLPGASVGMLRGAWPADGKRSKTVDVGKDVVVASIDSLASCGYPRAVLASFGTVIVDECHHLAASTLSQVLPQLPAAYVLGVSATPDRPDGLAHLLYFLAGPVSYVWRRVPQVTGVWGSVRVLQVVYSGGEQREVVYRGGNLGYAAMLNALADEEKRNLLLLALAVALLKTRKKVMIVTSFVAHASALGTALTEASGVPVARLYGTASTADMAAAKAPSTRAVLATYAMISEGFDDATIDTLLLALPRSGVQQVVGRVERTHEGKLRPLVVDLVDDFSLFKAMSFKRANFYKERGFAVERHGAAGADDVAGMRL